MSELKPNKMGLVAVEMLFSDAGLGFRKGEIRGVAPDVAAIMIERKHARLVDLKTAAKAE